jgi:hypothetical protein
MINILALRFILLLVTISTSKQMENVNEAVSTTEPVYHMIYDEIASDSASALPTYEVFELALKGYNNLKNSNSLKKNILTIADLSLPSDKKRLWVIDMDNKKVLFNDLVAHGRNSGENLAAKFSNNPESNMSSLGFYITGSTYTGKHGLSMFLDGLENEFNSNARQRAIVVHGADYVSDDFIRKYGRLGRSFGCPALSTSIITSVINTISGGSCLFIYYPDQNYLSRSNVLNMG